MHFEIGEISVTCQWNSSHLTNIYKYYIQKQFFCGLIFIMRSANKIQSETFLHSKTVSCKSTHQKELIILGNDNFENKFKIFGQNHMHSKILLSKQIKESILEFYKKINRPIYILFKDSKIYIIIELATKVFEPGIFSSGVTLSNIKVIHHSFSLAQYFSKNITSVPISF